MDALFPDNMVDSIENRENSDSFPEATGITIRLDAFEGPLDLLLHLIKKEEIDIWNIPIARILPV